MILTKHAQERVHLRKIKPSQLEQVISNPDKKYNNDDGVKFIKTIDGRRMHVVANYAPKQKDWVVVSAWVRGEDDPQPLLWQVLVRTIKFISRFWWWMLKTIWQHMRRLLNLE